MLSGKAFQCSRCLHGTSGAGRAIECYLPQIASEQSSATGTNCRGQDNFLASIAHFRDRSDNLGNYFSSPNNKYLISFPYPFLGKFIVIMECGPAHSYAPHIHRLKNGYGSNNSGSSDRVFDEKKLGSNVHSRKFIGNRVPGMVFRRSETVPKREGIKLNNQSIDLEIKHGTTHCQAMNLRLELSEIFRTKNIRGFAEPKRF